MAYKIVSYFHNDHDVQNQLLLDCIERLKPSGFFKETVTIPESSPDLFTNLYGPASGDPPVKGEVLVRDVNDEWRGATPFVNLPPRATRLLTFIGMAEGEDITIWTAYGGACAERIPSDPNIADNPEEIEKATKFWAVHALSIAAKK